MTSATAKVLRLRGSNEVVHLDDGPATIALCQRAIRASHRKYLEIGSRSGVCTQTVSNIASGQTKFPHMSTVVRILMALGWSVYASQHNG
jgi:hypothetical protein